MDLGLDGGGVVVVVVEGWLGGGICVEWEDVGEVVEDLKV